MEGLSIIGAVASIGGAIFALYQASKARTYRDEVRRDRLKMLLIEVMESARKARNECQKIVTPAEKPPRGVKPQAVVDAIRSFLNRILDHSHRFTIAKLPGTVKTAQNHLRRYVGEPDQARRYAAADDLYASLSVVISCIRQEIDGTL